MSEPAASALEFPGDPDDVPGLAHAEEVDLPIHDGMFTAEEYPHPIGWGHRSFPGHSPSRAAPASGAC